MNKNTTNLKFDATDNLLRVFQLPETVSADFCIPSGHPTNFTMVDWFRPSSKVGETIDIDRLREFIRTKNYYRPERNYLVMCRTGETFLVDHPMISAAVGLTNIMIRKEQYEQAIAQKDQAQAIINQYHKNKQETFNQRLVDNPIFADDELFYSATLLCPCGHGLAYPKECGANHYWDCSAILKGIFDNSVEHVGRMPFAFYDVKGESEHYGTTRGVFRPKATA